jgi:HPt (histidine-containing phosphotransfer) domain-containing protein
MPTPPPPNAAIAELATCLGEKDARELVGMFLQSFPTSMQTLATAERSVALRAAHSMKSSARIVGLFLLSRQMSELEDRLGKDNATVTPEDLSSAQEKYDAAAPALRAFVGTTPPSP